MFAWWRRMREAVDMVALLEAENEALRDQNADLRTDADILRRRLAGQQESLEVLKVCVERLNVIQAKYQEAAS